MLNTLKWTSPEQRITQLQRSTVPLLRNPDIGVGWLAACRTTLSVVSHPPAGCLGHHVIAMVQEQEQAELLEAFYSLSSELAHHYFCHILFAKASQKAFPDPRGMETDSTFLVRRTAFTWKGAYWMAWRMDATNQTDSLPSMGGTWIWNYKSVLFSLLPLVYISLRVLKILYFVIPTLRAASMHWTDYLRLAPLQLGYSDWLPLCCFNNSS